MATFSEPLSSYSMQTKTHSSLFSPSAIMPAASAAAPETPAATASVRTPVSSLNSVPPTDTLTYPLSSRLARNNMSGSLVPSTASSLLNQQSRVAIAPTALLRTALPTRTAASNLSSVPHTTLPTVADATFATARAPSSSSSRYINHPTISSHSISAIAPPSNIRRYRSLHATIRPDENTTCAATPLHDRQHVNTTGRSPNVREKNRPTATTCVTSSTTVITARTPADTAAAAGAPVPAAGPPTPILNPSSQQQPAGSTRSTGHTIRLGLHTISADETLSACHTLSTGHTKGSASHTDNNLAGPTIAAGHTVSGDGHTISAGHSTSCAGNTTATTTTTFAGRINTAGHSSSAGHTSSAGNNTLTAGNTILAGNNLSGGHTISVGRAYSADPHTLIPAGCHTTSSAAAADCHNGSSASPMYTYTSACSPMASSVALLQNPLSRSCILSKSLSTMSSLPADISQSKIGLSREIAAQPSLIPTSVSGAKAAAAPPPPRLRGSSNSSNTSNSNKTVAATSKSAVGGAAATQVHNNAPTAPLAGAALLLPEGVTSTVAVTATAAATTAAATAAATTTAKQKRQRDTSAPVAVAAEKKGVVRGGSSTITEAAVAVAAAPMTAARMKHGYVSATASVPGVAGSERHGDSSTLTTAAGTRAGVTALREGYRNITTTRATSISDLHKKSATETIAIERERQHGGPASMMHGRQEDLSPPHPLRRAWTAWQLLCFAAPPPGTSSLEIKYVNESLALIRGYLHDAEGAALAEGDDDDITEDSTAEEEDDAASDDEDTEIEDEEEKHQHYSSSSYPHHHEQHHDHDHHHHNHHSCVVADKKDIHQSSHSSSSQKRKQRSCNSTVDGQLSGIGDDRGGGEAGAHVRDAQQRNSRQQQQQQLGSSRRGRHPPEGANAAAAEQEEGGGNRLGKRSKRRKKKKTKKNRDGVLALVSGPAFSRLLKLTRRQGGDMEEEICRWLADYRVRLNRAFEVLLKKLEMQFHPVQQEQEQQQLPAELSLSLPSAAETEEDSLTAAATIKALKAAAAENAALEKEEVDMRSSLEDFDAEGVALAVHRLPPADTFARLLQLEKEEYETDRRLEEVNSSVQLHMTLHEKITQELQHLDEHLQLLRMEEADAQVETETKGTKTKKTTIDREVIE